MSISSALSNALSGLTVASRSADIISSNVANAMTDGYGVRTVDISSRIVGNSGAGARVNGITRHEDIVIVAYRREADAELAFQNTRSGYLGRLESLIGTPDQSGSLAARTAAFEAALTGAANSPHSQAHLTSAVETAGTLATQINSISDGIQSERLQADGDIGRAVDTINDRLDKLASLNTRIRQAQGGARDVSALLDAQAELLNEISPLISLKTRRDSMGALQLYSSDGQVLLDGVPSVLSFSPSGVMGPFMTDEASGLSALRLNGTVQPMTGQNASLVGGKLAALFEVRDTWGITAQAQIDGVARDLADRLGGTSLDPTITAGDPGLFTDGGALAVPANEVGLASRLRVNAAVLPDEGGAIWRIRDGLGASVEGPIGNADFLHRQLDALNALQAPASGGFSSASRNFAGLVSDHLTTVGFARQSAETDQSHAASLQNAVFQQELSQGVDTDAEMQKLLQIEQIFSANARVISAAQDMIDELMRMV